MPQVMFSRDYDWRVPGHKAVIAYRGGKSYFVKRACADQAVSDGAARITRARRVRPETGE